MIDMEGPSNPADKAGNHYTMTYMCCLCPQPLLEPLTNLTHGEVRRVFARLIFRSATILTLLRSDRGPEFRNLMMAEFVAPMGMRHRMGTQWRPMEQGMVKRIHQEMQKILSLLLQDVVKCHPEEWSELLPRVEFVIYNTPGPHGMTPRDIDRRWSMALPLEKELQPFQVLEFEPITEYAGNVFRAYREIKAKVLKHYAKSSEEG